MISNLEKFYFKKYTKLFDYNAFIEIKNYINYDLIINKINNKNIVYPSKKEFNKKLLNEYIIKYKDQELYLVIDNFFRLDVKLNNIYYSYNRFIKPNKKILSIYNYIKNNILKEKYNYIHLRFEKDFERIFGKKYLSNIEDLLSKVKFKNDYKIYLACSNINEIINSIPNNNNIINKNNILFKDELIKNINLNFEEKAFVDLLIGINSQEFFGNKKSSFSLVLSILKNTKNFYN